ncbi:hypothetical protein PX699_22820 [Sphingobium sp. H39-3-25]|uniref:hypothetical protein n=1 Tax=Sphingomonadales TaxID=204457 RepID=UPI000831B49A|nr:MULTISPECIES: hypothetical protein [Sphingomonadaceae]MDF0491079.1 hypothetical protein [Sphingomonas pollutisoli]MDF0545190.1 hypothetical protein [Sphingobium arseniciresistens]
MTSSVTDGGAKAAKNSVKLFTLDKTILMDVASVAPHEQGIVIEGKIMGTMPMKVVLRPEELRAALKFVTPGLIWTLVKMLFRRPVQAPKKK